MTSSPSADPSPFVEYFKEVAAGEAARKTSLEQRGSAVIATSGTVTTLLFGLVALVTQSSDFDLPVQAKGPIGVALALLVGACVLSIVTNAPAPYIDVRITEPADQLKALWAKQPDDAWKVITSTRMQALKRAKFVNDIKAWVVVAAFVLEVGGVVSIAIAVREVLLHT